MSKKFSLLFYVKKSKTNAKGIAPIYLRITVDGKRAELSIQRTVQIQKWDSSKGRVKGNTESVKAVNFFIDTVQSKIYEHHQQLLQRNKRITAQSIKSAYQGIGEKRRSLLEVFQLHNNAMERLIGKQFSKSTYTKYKTSLKHVKEFLRYNYRIDDIFLEDVTFEFITKFDSYMRVEGKMSNNTAVKYITHLRKIINEAIKREWLVKDPFKGYKLKIEEIKKEFLIEEELKLLHDKKIDIERIAQVRDVFLFCCYTGLAYSDVSKLSPENLRKGIDGELWIHVYRTKTNTVSRIPLLDPAVIDIINKYKNNLACNSACRLLPVLSNQKMNAYLKEIADLCGIKKNLTMHVARHTFATYMLTRGITLETVSAMMGHKSIKTTQIYAKITNQKIYQEMKTLNKTNLIKLSKIG